MKTMPTATRSMPSMTDESYSKDYPCLSFINQSFFDLDSSETNMTHTPIKTTKTQPIVTTRSSSITKDYETNITEENNNDTDSSTVDHTSADLIGTSNTRVNPMKTSVTSTSTTTDKPCKLLCIDFPLFQC